MGRMENKIVKKNHRTFIQVSQISVLLRNKIELIFYCFDACVGAWERFTRASVCVCRNG